ncbi:MAG: TonB-dependent receptor [Muribaculaceae bacterium]|nr:TonB-dependent receptor [Muribaculaceae bacterium]
MNNLTYTLTCGCVAILAAVAPHGLSASTFASPSPAEGESVRTDSVHRLMELNVVAIKQADVLRDDAVASTVLGLSELDELNTVSLKGISDVVPNFYIPDYGSRITSTIYVRGIGARMDQPAVGLNIDNVPFLNKNAYDFDLADIASVEMLRGPQSTLYGRNTIGGLVNITTLSPQRYQGWRIMAQGARGNDWKASVGWYHKFNQDIATAVIASGSYLGGFFRNAYDGKRLDHERSAALRWKFDWRPSQSVQLRNAASASILRQGGYPYEYVATGEINYNDTCFYRRFIFNDGLTLNWRSDRFTMSSITSVQYLDDNMTLDQDFLPLPYFTITQRQRETSVTQDVVFRGHTSGKYTWVAGVFGFFKNMDMQAPVTFKDTGIASLIEEHRNGANPDYPIRWNAREFPLNSDFNNPTGGAALYHESTLNFGSWQIVAGLRLDWEMARLNYRSMCDTGYRIYSYDSNGQLVPYRDVAIDIDDRGHLKRSYFNWLPKLSVLYRLPMEGENNVYANVAKGYKAGGFNTQMFSDVLQQRLMGVMGIGAKYDVDEVVGYRPEYSWNYEIGSHLSFPSARINFDLSAFYIDCRDQQLTMFPSGNTTGRIMTNAGRTRSVGMEAAVKWNPVGSLEVAASYGYTNARFMHFYNGISDFKGKFLPYAPQNTLFLQAQYTFSFRREAFLKSLCVEADMRGTGKIYWNEENSISQSFYALPGASVTLDGGVWSLQIWGKNLSDKDYHTFYFKSMGNEFLQRGRPIQIGATLRFEIK